MIIWYGQWADRTPPGIYRISYDNGFVIENRRELDDEWEVVSDDAITISEWYGMRHLYEELELLV